MIELAATLRGTRAHYTADLEPLDDYVPGVPGRHGSSLCSRPDRLTQVFDQQFMDHYPPPGRKRCVIDTLRLCKICRRLRENET